MKASVLALVIAASAVTAMPALVVPGGPEALRLGESQDHRIDAQKAQDRQDAIDAHEKLKADRLAELPVPERVKSQEDIEAARIASAMGVPDKRLMGYKEKMGRKESSKIYDEQRRYQDWMERMDQRLPGEPIPLDTGKDVIHVEEDPNTALINAQMHDPKTHFRQGITIGSDDVDIIKPKEYGSARECKKNLDQLRRQYYRQKRKYELRIERGLWPDPRTERQLQILDVLRYRLIQAERVWAAQYATLQGHIGPDGGHLKQSNSWRGWPDSVKPDYVPQSGTGYREDWSRKAEPKRVLNSHIHNEEKPPVRQIYRENPMAKSWGLYPRPGEKLEEVVPNSKNREWDASKEQEPFKGSHCPHDKCADDHGPEAHVEIEKRWGGDLIYIPEIASIRKLSDTEAEESRKHIPNSKNREWVETNVTTNPHQDAENPILTKRWIGGDVIDGSPYRKNNYTYTSLRKKTKAEKKAEAAENKMWEKKWKQEDKEWQKKYKEDKKKEDEEEAEWQRKQVGGEKYEEELKKKEQEQSEPEKKEEKTEEEKGEEKDKKKKDKKKKDEKGDDKKDSKDEETDKKEDDKDADSKSLGKRDLDEEVQPRHPVAEAEAEDDDDDAEDDEDEDEDDDEDDDDIGLIDSDDLDPKESTPEAKQEAKDRGFLDPAKAPCQKEALLDESGAPINPHDVDQVRRANIEANENYKPWQFVERNVTTLKLGSRG